MNTIGMAEKLGDLKVKKSAGEALSAIGEKLSLQFVFSQGKQFIIVIIITVNRLLLLFIM
jgi:hypothetical protein